MFSRGFEEFVYADTSTSADIMSEPDFILLRANAIVESYERTRFSIIVSECEVLLTRGNAFFYRYERMRTSINFERNPFFYQIRTNAIFYHYERMRFSTNTSECDSYRYERMRSSTITSECDFLSNTRECDYLVFDGAKYFRAPHATAKIHYTVGEATSQHERFSQPRTGQTVI